MSRPAQTRTAPVVHSYEGAEVAEIAARMPNRVLGPRALGGSPRRFLRLTWMLAYLDFKLKFFGSVLGYAWQLMRPLMMFAVLYVVFSKILRFGSVDHYPVVLLSGIVLFGFFAEASNGSVSAIVEREGLVRKIAFPLLTVPLSTVTSLFLTLALNYLVVLAFALLTGISPTLRWLEIAPLLLLLYLVTASVGTALSALFVRYRDVRPAWEVTAQVLFYASPVIWPIEFVSSPTVQKVILCNPVAAIIQQLRHAVIDPSAPTTAGILGSWELLMVPIGIALALAVLAYVTISRMAPRVAEEI